MFASCPCHPGPVHNSLDALPDAWCTLLPRRGGASCCKCWSILYSRKQRLEGCRRMFFSRNQSWRFCPTLACSAPSASLSMTDQLPGICLTSSPLSQCWMANNPWLHRLDMEIFLAACTTFLLSAKLGRFPATNFDFSIIQAYSADPPLAAVVFAAKRTAPLTCLSTCGELTLK